MRLECLVLGQFTMEEVSNLMPLLQTFQPCNFSVLRLGIGILATKLISALMLVGWLLWAPASTWWRSLT